jgi:hypothetical protein
MRHDRTFRGDGRRNCAGRWYGVVRIFIRAMAGHPAVAAMTAEMLSTCMRANTPLLRQLAHDEAS